VYPALQTQDAEAVDPVPPVPALLAVHAVHAADPVVLLYVPSAHAVHDVACDPVYPALQAQAVDTVLVVPVVVAPAVQLVQDADPVADL